MEFLTPGQRIKKIRKMLNMKQHDLQGERVKRNFISMLENGERGLSKDTARYLAEKFTSRAAEMGIELQIDESYILMSQEEEARRYCLEKLTDTATIHTIDTIIDISIRFNLNDIEALAYLTKGDRVFDERVYSKALTYYVQALGKYSSINDKSLEAYLFNKLGLCKLNEMHIGEALEFFNKAYSFSIVNNDLRTRKNSTYNISLCYRKLCKIDESIEYIDAYLALCDKRTEFTNYVYANVIKANCLRDKKEFDKAIDIYKYLLGCFNNLNDSLSAFVYENLGLLYSEIMEYEKAIECIDIAQKIRTELDIANLAKSLIDKASIFIRQKKYSEALLLIDLGIDMAKKYNDCEYELKGYYMLVDIYLEIGCKNKLEDIYVKMLDIIKESRNYKEILNIGNKLCLIYLDENNIEKARELMKKSRELV